MSEQNKLENLLEDELHDLHNASETLEDRESQTSRLRNRKKSNAAKQAWRKHHYNYMRGNRKKSRDNMNSFLAIAKELHEKTRIIEAKMDRDNVFDYKCNISFEKLIGGLSFSINKETGNVSFSTYLSENAGVGNYKLENGTVDQNQLDVLYDNLKDEL